MIKKYFYIVFCIFFVLTKNIYSAHEKSSNMGKQNKLSQFFKKIKTQQLTSKLLCACAAIKKPVTLAERTYPHMPWTKMTAHERRMAEIKRLVEQGADVNMLLQDTRINKSATYQEVLAQQSPDTVTKHLGPFNTNKPGYVRASLHAAVESNSPELVQYLLAAKASIQTQIPQKELAYMKAWNFNGSLHTSQIANCFKGYRAIEFAQLLQRLLDQKKYSEHNKPSTMSSDDFLTRETQDNTKIIDILKKAHTLAARP